jgi:hypothetical protein
MSHILGKLWVFSHFAVINLVLSYGQSCSKFWVQGGQEQVQAGNKASKGCQICQNVIGLNDGFSQWIKIYVSAVCTKLRIDEST